MPVSKKTAIQLGQTIRRIRMRMNKSQAEFADALGSQRNSISRYEQGIVEPSLPLLWKLFGLAEADEKSDLLREIRLKVGSDLGFPATETARFDEELLRDIVRFERELDGVYDLNRSGRADLKKFSAAVFDLFVTGSHIDDAVIELLNLWKTHGREDEAAALFRQAVAYLRVALAKPK